MARPSGVIVTITSLIRFLHPQGGPRHPSGCPQGCPRYLAALHMNLSLPPSLQLNLIMYVIMKIYLPNAPTSERSLSTLIFVEVISSRMSMWSMSVATISSSSSMLAFFSLELIGSLKLVSVMVFVQLIFGPCFPMNQLNKNPDIA